MHVVVQIVSINIHFGSTGTQVLIQAENSKDGVHLHRQRKGHWQYEKLSYHPEHFKVIDFGARVHFNLVHERSESIHIVSQMM